jgi:hypothetical protein
MSPHRLSHLSLLCMHIRAAAIGRCNKLHACSDMASDGVPCTTHHICSYPFRLSGTAQRSAHVTHHTSHITMLLLIMHDAANMQQVATGSATSLRLLACMSWTARPGSQRCVVRFPECAKHCLECVEHFPEVRCPEVHCPEVRCRGALCMSGLSDYHQA